MDESALDGKWAHGVVVPGWVGNSCAVKMNIQSCKYPETAKTTEIRLPCLGIMGDGFKAPLKAIGPSQHYRIERFKGGP